MIPPSSPAAPDNRPRVLHRLASPTGLAVATLVGITLAFYHGLWLPGLVLLKRDAFRFWLPLKQHMIERLSTGELPQWFPYEALGRPFIGTAATGVFHPFTALYFLMPAADAHRASVLLSCLLAALGIFVLARRLRISRAGALVAGTAFALSGYVVSFTEHLIYLYSMGVLPFFLVALEKTLNETRRWVPAPAVIWATVFLHGDGQTGYYYGFIALLWTFARAAGPLRDACLRLGLVAILAALLAGVQLWPAAAVYVSSHRMQAGSFHDVALHWSTHPLRLVTVLAAPIGDDDNPVAVGRLFFGTPQQGAIGGMLTDSLYLGVPVAGLGLLGAWYRRDLRVLALLGGVALLLALGRFGVLYEMFYQVVPLWSAFRYPEKLMGVCSFAAAILAGAGLDALRAGKGGSAPWFVAAILCAGAWVGLQGEVAGAWTAAHFGAPETVARAVTHSAAHAFLWSAAAAAGTGLLVVSIRRRLFRETALLATLVMIVTLDLSRANLNAYHTGPAETASFVPPLAEAIQAREGTRKPGRFRLVSLFEPILVWPNELMPALGFHGAGSVERRQALDLEHNAAFHLESAMPYLPGHSSVFEQTLASRIGMEAAARFNVAYYTGRRYHLKDPRLAHTLVADLPPYDLALFQNPIQAKPRVYLSRRPERAASPLDPAVLLARPDFLNGDVDVIETTDASLPGPVLSGSAAIERYAPEEVRVRVATPQPAVLILLDAFDQGWTATLENGVKTPILRANVLVRAVVVPAGDHTVTFRYETPLLRVGAAASFAGMLLCLGMIVYGRWRRRAHGRRG